MYNLNSFLKIEVEIVKMLECPSVSSRYLPRCCCDFPPLERTYTIPTNMLSINKFKKNQPPLRRSLKFLFLKSFIPNFLSISIWSYLPGQ